MILKEGALTSVKAMRFGKQDYSPKILYPNTPRIFICNMISQHKYLEIRVSLKAVR